MELVIACYDVGFTFWITNGCNALKKNMEVLLLYYPAIRRLMVPKIRIKHLTSCDNYENNDFLIFRNLGNRVWVRGAMFGDNSKRYMFQAPYLYSYHYFIRILEVTSRNKDNS